MKEADWRKREIEDLADFIATEKGTDSFPIDLAAIAEDNGLTFSLGDYEEYFDGMPEYEDGHFHIYINNRGHFPLSTARIRFSF